MLNQEVYGGEAFWHPPPAVAPECPRFDAFVQQGTERALAVDHVVVYTRSLRETEEGVLVDGGGFVPVLPKKPDQRAQVVAGEIAWQASGPSVLKVDILVERHHRVDRVRGGDRTGEQVPKSSHVPFHQPVEIGGLDSHVLDHDGLRGDGVEANEIEIGCLAECHRPHVRMIFPSIDVVAAAALAELEPKREVQPNKERAGSEQGESSPTETPPLEQHVKCQRGAGACKRQHGPRCRTAYV